LQGEKVKSLEELVIANFLFLNGIAYEYEKVYPGGYEKDGRAYQPDFYLVDYDIWLEHFGINKNGRAPWIENDFEETRYVEGIKWKRGVHRKNGTHLIESYSYWNQEHELLNNLEDLLVANDIELNEDIDRLVKLYLDLKQDEKFSKSMIDLISTFISLYKANNTTIEVVNEKAHQVYASEGFMWSRYKLFVSFVAPIISFYKTVLDGKDQVDFDDMINHATEKIRKNGLTEQYKYIIVDEYQDISKSRFGLIKAIREQTNAKLICVGDDWQSIYRFAGSDVTLFTSFEQFGGYHEQLKIENTYRNSQQLINIASRFIMKNEHQVSKEMISSKTNAMPVIILAEKNQQEAIADAIESIIASHGGAEMYTGSILILGRHNFDLESVFEVLKQQNGKRVESGDFVFARGKKAEDVCIEYKGFKNIKFMSVHRAKGLEADDVIILNLKNDLYGFPNKIADDPILNLLLADSDDYPYAEERRLFYVAITRTRNCVYLVTSHEESFKGSSAFVKELAQDDDGVIGIIDDGETRSPALCPRCGTGTLVIRRNSINGREFLGCTNYPYCEKRYNSVEILDSQVKCPKCGGWMVNAAAGMVIFTGVRTTLIAQELSTSPRQIRFHTITLIRRSLLSILTEAMRRARADIGMQASATSGAPNVVLQ
jgi:DNA helicase-4